MSKLVRRERAPPGHDLGALLRVERLLLGVGEALREERRAAVEVVLVARAHRVHELVRDDDVVAARLRARSANTCTMPTSPFCSPCESGTRSSCAGSW